MPEVRRSQEIKAGVITGSVGLGIAVVLFVFISRVRANLSWASELSPIPIQLLNWLIVREAT